MPKTEDFREELQAQIQRAHKQGRPHVEVNSGELHRTLGATLRRLANAPQACPRAVR